jgi:hypothetical protein
MFSVLRTGRSAGGRMRMPATCGRSKAGVPLKIATSAREGAVLLGFLPTRSET